MNSNVGMATSFSNAISCIFFLRPTGCLTYFHFKPNFIRIVWTCPIHHILLLAPWKTEVGVLFLGNLPLLCWRNSSWIEKLEIAFGWGPGHLWIHTSLEDLWAHYMILEVSWDGLWTLLLGSHNLMVRLLACVWNGPKPWYPMPTSKLEEF